MPEHVAYSKRVFDILRVLHHTFKFTRKCVRAHYLLKIRLKMDFFSQLSKTFTECPSLYTRSFWQPHFSHRICKCRLLCSRYDRVFVSGVVEVQPFRKCNFNNYCLVSKISSEDQILRFYKNSIYFRELCPVQVFQ